MTLYLITDINYIILFNIIFIFVVVFLERKNPKATLAWVLCIMIFPVVGFTCYILFSQDFARKPMFKTKNTGLEKYEDNLQKKMDDYTIKVKSNPDFKYKNYDSIINFHHRHSESPLTTNNDVIIFSDGKDKFNQLIEDIENAKASIHILYYIFKDDQLGNRIIKILEKKAAEGIEVRLMFDAFGSIYTNRKNLKPLQDAGGKVAEFFPSFIPFLNIKANYRNHRKIVVIDGKIGYTGGFNVGDEYLGKDEKFGYWRDTHLRITGDAVHSMQARFLLDWRFASKTEISYNSKYFPSTKNNDGDVNIQIVSSGPDSKDEHIKEGYIKLINAAKKTIYIQSPYFIPDEAMVTALKLASLSGVDVKIMIPCMPDHVFVYWASYSYIGDLLPYGIEAYTYQNGFLHAKTIVIDGEVCSVGTANFDIRSFQLDFEVNAFIYDEGTSRHLKRLFLQDVEKSHQITLNYYKNRSNYIKMKEGVSRLLSPIL